MALIDMMETFQMTNPGAHIDATDVYNSNDNLLDNAYFVGGGSQLGDGIFPINQRGQTQYTAAGFVFDRWFKSGGVTATLDAGGLTIANSNGWPDGVNQRFPMHFFAKMNGEAITASVLYEDGTIDSGTAVIDATQNYQWLKYPNAGEIGFQLKNFQDGAPYDYFDYISFGAGPNSTPKKIKAFKLEKGTISTIANDAPPNYDWELFKCQTQFLRLRGTNYWILNGVVNNATTVDFLLPFGIRRFAKTPTISMTGSHSIRVGSTNYTVSSMVAQMNADNILTGIRMTISSGSLTTGTLATYGSGPNAYFDVDARI